MYSTIQYSNSLGTIETRWSTAFIEVIVLQEHFVPPQTEVKGLSDGSVKRCKNVCLYNYNDLVSGAIFLVTFVLLGFNLSIALIVTFTVSIIIVNLLGLMYIWNVTLNAVSLVNLVMVCYAVH